MRDDAEAALEAAMERMSTAEKKAAEVRARKDRSDVQRVEAAACAATWRRLRFIRVQGRRRWAV